MPATTFIYTLSCPTNHGIRYIGKANDPNDRYKCHISEKKKNTHKSKWISSLANQGLRPIIEVIDEIPLCDWIFWEQHYISLYKSWGFDLVNSDFGGTGTGTMSQEIKNKISATHRGSNNPFFGKKHTEITRDKMRKLRKGEKHPLWGKRHSYETILKQSEAKIGKPSPMKGKQHSEGAKNKMSISRTGLKQSDATKAERSNRMTGKGNHRYGKKLSQDVRDKISNSLKNRTKI